MFDRFFANLRHHFVIFRNNFSELFRKKKEEISQNCSNNCMCILRVILFSSKSLKFIFCETYWGNLTNVCKHTFLLQLDEIAQHPTKKWQVTKHWNDIEIFRDTKRYVEIYRGIYGYIGMYMDISGYIGVYRLRSCPI